jgi:transposase InsO family protein
VDAQALNHIAEGRARGGDGTIAPLGGEPLQGPRVFFASYGITIERVMIDNGPCARSRTFAKLLFEQGIRHPFIRPHRPQAKGKVGRFNRTLRDEWACALPCRSEAARTRALDAWLHLNSHDRHHSAIKGRPVSRVNNLSGENS